MVILSDTSLPGIRIDLRYPEVVKRGTQEMCDTARTAVKIDFSAKRKRSVIPSTDVLFPPRQQSLRFRNETLDLLDTLLVFASGLTRHRVLKVYLLGMDAHKHRDSDALD